jgi:hypothetical protein
MAVIALTGKSIWLYTLNIFRDVESRFRRKKMRPKERMKNDRQQG